MSATARFAGWTVLAALLHGAGRGDLAPPPLHSVSGLCEWIDARGAVVAVLASVRALACLAAAYLAVLTVLAAVAARLHDPRLRRVVRAVSTASVRKLVASTAGTFALLPTAPASAAPSDAAVAVMVRLPDPTNAPEPEVDESAVPSDDRWVVAAGDSFWSIASEAMTDHFGREASAGEIDGYWRVVVAANADRLVDPSDPDLLRPGQELVLPPVG